MVCSRLVADSTDRDRLDVRRLANLYAVAGSALTAWQILELTTALVPTLRFACERLGQSTREGYMPLEEFIEETLALFAQNPTPEEILVERVKGFRFAERDGTVKENLDMLAKR